MVRQTLTRIRTFIQKYDRYLASAAILIGFVIDSFVFTRVDVWWNNLLLLMHLGIAAAGIALFGYAEEKGFRNKYLQIAALTAPLFVQYSFGALFSALIIFYSRSASFALSWVFVAALLLLLIFSEAFSHNYRRFRYQMMLFFFLLLTFAAFFVPVIIGMIGHLVLLLSALIAVGAMVGLIFLLKRIIPERIREAQRFLAFGTAGITAAFISLYFVGAIPPLPLSLEDAQVAHAVARAGDEYRVSHEPKEWYAFWERYNTTFHRASGQAVYVYVSVFAPTRISFSLVHEWQRYDEASTKWVTVNSIAYPASGGRDGGYRGYTMKSNISPGKWRVNVKTSYGLAIGRVDFTVVAADEAPRTEERIY